MKEILYDNLMMNELKVGRKIRPVDFNPFLSNFPILYPPENTRKHQKSLLFRLYLKYLNFIRFLMHYNIVTHYKTNLQTYKLDNVSKNFKSTDEYRSFLYYYKLFKYGLYIIPDCVHGTKHILSCVVTDTV